MQQGENWRECPDCGLLCKLPPRYPGLVADCPRCGETLWRMRRSRRSYPLSCAVAALVLYCFALIAPFLEIQAYGHFALARLDTGPKQLITQGYGLAGALVFLVTLVAPAVKLGLLITVLSGLRVLPPAWLKPLFRFYHALAPWAMIDVYLLGFLVAYTKLIGLASVHLDTAVFALVGCMVCMAAADGSVDTEQIWRTLDKRAAAQARPAPGAIRQEAIQAETIQPQAMQIGCLACGYVNTTTAELLAQGQHCRRCNAPLYSRKPESMSRSWSLLLASVAMYIPANVYPFMVLTSLAHSTAYTIFGGIIELAQSGLWPLALLVFFASITIPLLKIILLGYMLISAQLRSTAHLRPRTMAYRFIDFIGRWSMIDVFMVSILIALMRFGQFASVHAAFGAVCFASVVVLTIFAVQSFDPRLMWDAEHAA